MTRPPSDAERSSSSRTTAELLLGGPLVACWLLCAATGAFLLLHYRASPGRHFQDVFHIRTE